MKLATRTKKLSGVLAFESMPEHGYCRKTVPVVVEANMDIGAVLTLSGGNYVWMTAATSAAATSVAVLIDGQGVPTLSLTPGTYNLAVLIRGPSAVVDIGLIYKDALSAPQKLVVQGKLEAQGILTRNGY